MTGPQADDGEEGQPTAYDLGWREGYARAQKAAQKQVAAASVQPKYPSDESEDRMGSGDDLVSDESAAGSQP